MRFLRILLAFLIMTFLSWRILTLGLAEHRFAHDDIDGTLALVSDHSRALAIQAMRLIETDLERSLDHLERSLIANPARGINYARAGTAWELGGQPERARIAIDLAVRLAPAQVDSRLIAAAFELGRNRLDAVLAHWSIAMERRASLRQELFPVLLNLAGEPGGIALLAPLANARSLLWWPDFIAHVARHAANSDTAAKLFALSQSSGVNKLKGFGLEAALKRFQRDGHWLDARLAWMSSLSDRQLSGLGNLFNGGFEDPISDLGFDWIRQRAGHIQIERAPAVTNEGFHALRVHFRGPRIQYRHLSQLLALRPGEYTLDGMVRPDGFEAVHGLAWTVSCLGAREHRIGETAPFKGRGPWTRFETAFAVPPKDCPAQILRLQLEGRIALDFEASGTIWFDDMSIKIKNSPTPPP